jgi:protoporphyrinogen oxidase
MNDAPITILGAGLSGAGCARELPGSVVYEAKAHPGGHVWSHEQHGVHYDEGAHISHTKDVAWQEQIAASAGRVVTIPQSRVANYWRGHWTTYPVQNHLRELPPELRIRALNGLVAAQVAHQGKTAAHYAEWIHFQYGPFLAEEFYRRYTDKYWRTPMEAMDTDWLSGRLLPSQMERIIHGAIAPLDEKQSVFSSFRYPERGGFFAFHRALFDGLDIRLNARLVRVDALSKSLHFADGRTASYGRLVSTIPLPVLLSCMEDVPDGLRADAASLRHTQMLGINVLINRPGLCPHHWFYIYDPEIPVSRVKVMSNVTPAGCPPGTTSLQTEIFRRDDEVFDVPALQRQTVLDMSRLLGFDPEREVLAVDHVIASHAYPIPTLGRAAAVQRIADWLAGRGIITTGLYGRWNYLWSDAAFRAGQEVGRALRAGG